ncbi:hypothetical protein [Acidisoma silvae]|uniref:Uncharacterized protein n=1 Tax=Acidisoma silvae TaxID=2802396 RepID=A0A963YNF5_9PROT|nr:hypothetical protein [Acidisoma silvae]MCB8873777.1 hypothetical protein [Acidisoma silvae]
MSQSGSNPPSHSQAFERLVENGQDLTGLLAYALYKQAIREAALQGAAVHRSEHRSPVPVEITAYRSTADNMLTAFAGSIIEQSREDIEESARRSYMAAMEERLNTEFRKATNWRSAIAVNLIAWLLSIAITFLIAVSGVPHWIAVIAHSVGG